MSVFSDWLVFQISPLIVIWWRHRYLCLTRNIFLHLNNSQQFLGEVMKVHWKTPGGSEVMSQNFNLLAHLHSTHLSSIFIDNFDFAFACWFDSTHSYSDYTHILTSQHLVSTKWLYTLLKSCSICCTTLCLTIFFTLGVIGVKYALKNAPSYIYIFSETNCLIWDI